LRELRILCVSSGPVQERRPFLIVHRRNQVTEVHLNPDVANPMIKSLYALAGQQVVGRAVRDIDGTPVPEALIILLDDSRPLI
jgi:hypothetical protein